LGIHTWCDIYIKEAPENVHACLSFIRAPSGSNQIGRNSKEQSEKRSAAGVLCMMLTE